MYKSIFFHTFVLYCEEISQTFIADIHIRAHLNGINIMCYDHQLSLLLLHQLRNSICTLTQYIGSLGWCIFLLGNLCFSPCLQSCLLCIWSLWTIFLQQLEQGLGYKLSMISSLNKLIKNVKLQKAKIGLNFYDRCCE